MPILPSYLYSLDQDSINTSGTISNSTISPFVIQHVRNISGASSSILAPPQHNPALTSSSTIASSPPDSNCSNVDGQLDEVNVKVGLLLASKSAVQLIINPFIGPLTNRWVTLTYSSISQTQKDSFIVYVTHCTGLDTICQCLLVSALSSLRPPVSVKPHLTPFNRSAMLYFKEVFIEARTEGACTTTSHP